jgi:polysaccharide export outer membrane protein
MTLYRATSRHRVLRAAPNQNLLLCCAIGLLLTFASAADAQQPKPSAKPRPETSRPTAPKPAPERAPGAAETQLATPPTTAAQREEPLTEPVFVPVDPAKAYFLGSGDLVRVNVYQQPDMAVEGRVSEAGTLTVPLVGTVEVRGLTARQVETRIAYLLKRGGYVREPQVNVSVVQFRSRDVAVLGYVNRPGRYYLEEGIYRVTDVLALAGGATPTAGDIVTLMRTRDNKVQKFDTDVRSLFKSANPINNMEVLPGDSLYVDRAPVFYIYGEVQRPGAFRLEKDITLMQAVSIGGGLTLRGSKKNIQITRKDGEGKVTLLTAQLGDRFVLWEDDVIFVQESLF